MKQDRLSQEQLKLIACITMLIDHIGATVLPYIELRLIGRLAFPIFCFLMAEGVHYTRAPLRYGMRLLIGMLLSEIPFDFALFGGFTWAHQSVMVTLFLGFLGAMCMKRTDKLWLQLLLLIPFAAAADLLQTDYGGMGVILVGMFVLTRDVKNAFWIRTLLLAVICYLIGGACWYIRGIAVPLEMFAVFAMIPIGLYSGRKSTSSPLLQWGFYLFYPVHLAVLWLILTLNR